MRQTFHIVLFVLVLLMIGHIQTVSADERESVKTLHGRYKQASDETKRRDALIEISKKEPKTGEDINELRAVFSKKDYDEHLFEAAAESLKKAHDPMFAGQLIDILKDEQPYMDKAVKKDFQGKSEGERRRRGNNVVFIITNLGRMKSQSAVPVLKDYLKYPGYSYYASEALSAIGDKSAAKNFANVRAKGKM